MAWLFWLFILTIYGNIHCSNYTNSGKINATNETFVDWDRPFGFTEQDVNATLPPFSVSTMPADNLTTFPNETVVTETSILTTSSKPDRSGTSSLPLPLSGILSPPVTKVSDLCPCNVQSERCETNCCCDPDCSQELPLFTSCSVPKVLGETKLCTQDTALYILTIRPDGLSQVQTSVRNEVNPDIFCIQSVHYEQGMSFVTPTIPTEKNFDDLFNHFVGFFFGTSDAQSSTLQTSPQENSPGYQYGDIILMEDNSGNRGFFRLPGSGVTAHCFDTNPAAFLKDQVSRCVRSFALVQDCARLEALNLRTYSSFWVFSGKGKEATLVPVVLEAVTLQSLEGTQTLADMAAVSAYQPILMDSAEVCRHVVLQCKYTVSYSENGQIVGVTASIVLGTVDSSMLPVQQLFQIVFIQEAKSNALLRFSGNPGYVVGLPLVAGWRTAEGVVRRADPEGSLRLLHATAGQDCLLSSPQRSPVLFGKDVVSGCTFRLADGANCSLVSEALLWRVKGQNFPDYVASFGNSLPQNPMDWVPIENKTTSTLGCSIPLSYHVEVRWTKYGTLENPQAQIVSITEIIQTNTSILPALSSLMSSVSFIDVSAAASPGFRAPPTINAKLPFDFFFPFV